jgi:hypothetical protein
MKILPLLIIAAVLAGCAGPGEGYATWSRDDKPVVLKKPGPYRDGRGEGSPM